MDKTMFRAVALAGVIGVLVGFPLLARSQDRVTPSIACDGPSTNNVKGLLFQFRSAVLTPWNGGGQSHLRITLGIRNSTDTPIGAFIYQHETSASTDTGLALEMIQTSGMSLCGYGRDDCAKSGTVTTISPGSITNAILVLQGAGPTDDLSKQEVLEAKSIDFAGVVYAVVGSEKGFLPVSCVGMPLRNMTAH